MTEPKLSAGSHPRLQRRDRRGFAPRSGMVKNILSLLDGPFQSNYGAPVKDIFERYFQGAGSALAEGPPQLLTDFCRVVLDPSCQRFELHDDIQHERRHPGEQQHGQR